MTRLQTLGARIGRAHFPGEGMATVYASESKTHVTVKIDRTGREYWMPRTRVKWRPDTHTEQKETAA